MDKKGQLGAGVVLSYLSQALQIIVTLFYTPIMLRMLGQSEYGLYQLTYSVVSYLSLFTFGFSSSYIKFYSNCKTHKDSKKRISELNGMFFSIFTVLGFVVFALGVILVINTDAVLGGNLSRSELASCKVLMGIMIVNCSLHFPAIVFNNYIIAHEKFVWLQIINLIGIILNPCLTFPLLLMGYKSVSLAITLLVITIVKLVVSSLYCICKIQYEMSFSNMKFRLLKEIGIFSGWIFIENIVSTINVSLDRFLLGKMVGSISVAIYAVGGQINTLYTTLSTSIASVFTPRINKIVAESGDDGRLSRLLIKVGKIQLSILMFVLLGFTIFGRRFMLLWAGDGYENAYYVALILIFPNTIELIQNIAIEIQRAKNLQKFRSVIYLSICICNVLVSIFFIHLWEEIGAALGTGLAWLIGSGFIMNAFYKKYVQLDILSFWKEMLYMGKIAIPLLILGYITQPYINSCPLLIYVFLILAFSVIYLSLLYLFGLRKSERIYINNCIKKLFIK